MLVLAKEEERSTMSAKYFELLVCQQNLVFEAEGALEKADDLRKFIKFYIIQPSTIQTFIHYAVKELPKKVMWCFYS